MTGGNSGGGTQQEIIEKFLHRRSLNGKPLSNKTNLDYERIKQP